MATYYLDGQYWVHVQQNAEQTYTPWEDAEGVFAGKCNAYIEGMRVVPDGATWTRGDGVAFAGLMIAPAMDCNVLDTAQAAYEQARDEADAAAADLSELLLDLNDRTMTLELGGDM